MVGLGKGSTSSIPIMKRKAQEGKEGAGLAKRAPFRDLTNARSGAGLLPGILWIVCHPDLATSNLLYPVNLNLGFACLVLIPGPLVLDSERLVLLSSKFDHVSSNLVLCTEQQGS